MTKSTDSRQLLLIERDEAFVEASRAPRLRDLDPERAELEILRIVNRTYAEMDKTPPGLNSAERQRYMQAISRMIIADMNQYFPQVTLTEVDTAIRRGVRREYGPANSFSVIRVHSFVDKYLESEERAAALAKRKRMMEKQSEAPVLTPAQKWDIVQLGFETCVEYYRKNRMILDCGNINYDLLVAAGEINLSLDEKRTIYDVARMQVQKEQESQAFSYRMACALRRKTEANDGIIRSRAKDISLKNYLDTTPDITHVIPRLKDAYMRTLL